MTTAGGALAFDGRFRVAFVVFGGLAVLQSSQDLDATKIAYLIGSVVCLAAALGAVWRLRRTPEVRRATPWLAASAALAVVIAISFVIARANETSLTDWVRDVATYALFATVPVFALDGQASASRKLLIGMLVLAGLLGGLSWAVEWLSRRQIFELPFSRILFPSAQLPSMLYLFATAMALTGARQRAMWIAIAGVTLGLFLVTGTRSSLLLLIGPVVMALLTGWARLRNTVRTLALHGAVAVAVVVLFQLTLILPAPVGVGRPPGGPSTPPRPTASSGPSILDDRFSSLPTVLTNPATDDSVRERVAQYQAAWTLFASSPLVGVGPGHSIEWVDVSGYPRSAFTADTPLVMPAKFGLLGVLVFLGFAAAYGGTVARALRRGRRSTVTLALAGFGAFAITGLPLGFLVEDKGTSLALILLLALAFTVEPAVMNESSRQGDLDASAAQPVV